MQVLEESRVEQITVKTYRCELCNYSSDYKGDVERHHGLRHACPAEMEVAGLSLHRFESEDDAKIWARSQGYDFQKVEWDGPGWYMHETWTEPCPRGCCRDSYFRLFPAACWVAEAVGRATETMDEVKAVRAALRGGNG